MIYNILSDISLRSAISLDMVFSPSITKMTYGRWDISNFKLHVLFATHVVA